jgi:hypothetical protein
MFRERARLAIRAKSSETAFIEVTLTNPTLVKISQ